MKKPLLICTAALPYANGEIHIGHLIEYIQADIYVRQHRQLGHRAVYICADDAHGTPVELAASKAEVAPEEYTDAVRVRHMADFARYNIAFDNYHSTHSPENRELVELIYERLCADGCIIAQTQGQLYDPVAKRFLADRYVTGDCPKCGAHDQYGDGCEKCGATYDALELINPVSAISGAVPVVRESEHLYFDLPGRQHALQADLDTIALNPSVRRKLEEWFEAGLRPWTITRDAPYFGFPVPDKLDKFFYVWLDAPIGYLASFKNYCERKGLDFWDELTAPDTRLEHFIGKDIITFHGLFWPAMLRSAGLPLPDALHCHGFLTVEGRKMSKSRGTFIQACDLADAIDPELFRYFVFAMVEDGIDDINLSFDALFDLINSDLVGKIANLGSRAAGVLGRAAQRTLSNSLASEAEYQANIQKLKEAQALILKRKYRSARKLVIEVATSANRDFAERQPWAKVKLGSEGVEAAARDCTQALLLFRAIIVTLEPVLPGMADRALRIFERSEGLDGLPLLGSSLVTEFPRLVERLTSDHKEKLLQSA